MINKQNLSVPILLFFVLVFQIGCKNDEEIALIFSSLKLEEFKVSTLKAKDTVNLIKAIKNNDRIIAIYYESGDSLVISKENIISIDQNENLWKASIKFRDNSILDLPMIGQITIALEDITLNPYLKCPLCAVINVKIPVKSRIAVKVHGKPNGGISIENKFLKYTEEHEVPILGLYSNWKNTVEISVLDLKGNVRVSKIIEIQTQPIKESSSMSVVTNKYPEKTTQLYFSANKPIGFDQTGAVRWAYEPASQFYYIFPKLKNGNLLALGSKDLYVYHSKYLYEITPLGLTVREYVIPNYIHHDIVELPNGNLLTLSNSKPIVFQDGVSEEETVIEIDRQSGAILKTWDFNNILAPQRKPIPSTRPDDWLHLNALFFDTRDNSIIVSGRSQSAVIKIDYATSAIKWILSSPELWPERFNAFLLKPVDNSGAILDTSIIDFWAYGQHSVKVKPNGNLILYDNGDSRNYYENRVALPEYSRLVEYKIDETKMTISFVNSFDNGKTLYTKYTGAVNYQPELNSTLIAYMFPSSVLPQPKIVEVDNSNNILFEANLSVDLANYRGFKMNIYSALAY